jgi:hypothetical protein
MRKPKKERLAKLGSVPEAKDNAADNVQVLPKSVDAMGGGMPVYEDVVYELDAQAYTMLRQCPAIYGPLDKAATAIGRKVWKVVGNKKGKTPPKEPMPEVGFKLVNEKLKLVEPVTGGARQKALQQIIDNMYGLKAATRAMIWGFIEGVIYCKVNTGKSIDGLDGAWVLPDLCGGVRKKVNAGGRLRHYVDDATGEVTLTRSQETNVHAPVKLAQPAELNPKDFLIFVPGANGNPEGEPDLAVNLFKIARLYMKVLKNLDRYTDRHGLPLELVLGNGRPSELGSLLQTKAQDIADRKPGQTVGLSTREKIELIEPKGQTADFLLQLKTDLEGDAARLILKSTLTSDTKASGPAGSSTVHKAEQDISVEAWAEQFADAMTDQLLPWIVEHNLDLPADDTLYHLELVDEEKENEVAEDNQQKSATVAVTKDMPTGANGVVQPAMPMPENK